MYPIPEFRAAANRRAGRGGLVALVVIGGAIAAFVGVCLLLRDHFLPEAGAFARRATGGGLIGLTAVVIPLSIWGWRRAARDPLARCPHCGKSLAGHVPLVVAARRCYHCGGVVLIDPDEPPEPSGVGATPPALPTRYEFVEADKKHQMVAAPVLLGGMIGSYLGCGGAAGVAGLLDLPKPVEWAVFAVLVAVVPVGTVAVVVSLFRRAKQNPALSCYWCGTVLAGNRETVATTRRCVKCGRTALAARLRPEPPPHAAPPFTVVEIDDRVAARRVVHRRNWRRFLWLLAVTLAAVAAPYAVLGGRTGFELWLTPRVGEIGAGLIAQFGPLFVLMFLLIAVAIGNGVAQRAAFRRHPLDCPRCGKAFLPHLAKATRCCHHCHWPIVT